MNGFRRVGVLVAFIIIAVSPRGEASEPISFHHLGGASTKAQVKKVFPQAEHYALCDGQIGHLADGDYRCDGLQLKEYTVNDLNFSVIFNFKTTDRLSGILITKLVGYNNLPLADRLSKNELGKLYDSQYALLSERYGQPLAGYSPCPVGDDALIYHRCERWQSGQSSKWRPGHDYVDLELDVQRDTDTSENYTGDLSIRYEFAPAGEANGP